MITSRDRQIINLLQERDFCLYKDITRKFFPSEESASNRLRKLRDKDWISIEPIHFFYLSNNINDLSLHLMGDNKKIVRLNRKHKITKKKASRSKMSKYKKSNQSHILYVVTNAKKITRFIKDFRSYKYVGITHYFDIEKLMSY